MTTESMNTDITPGFEDWANHMGLATKKDLANVSTGDEDDTSNTVMFTEFEYQGQKRKTIQLNNYDSISALDTSGAGHNLAMVSKWDVADFGAPNLHCNLNSKDGKVTINDNEEIATKSITDDLSSKIEALTARVVALESKQ